MPVRTLEDVDRRLKRANAILAQLSDSDRRMEIIKEEHLRRDLRPIGLEPSPAQRVKKLQQLEARENARTATRAKRS